MTWALKDAASIAGSFLELFNQLGVEEERGEDILGTN